MKMVWNFLVKHEFGFLRSLSQVCILANKNARAVDGRIPVIVFLREHVLHLTQCGKDKN